MAREESLPVIFFDDLLLVAAKIPFPVLVITLPAFFVVPVFLFVSMPFVPAFFILSATLVVILPGGSFGANCFAKQQTCG